MKLRKNLVLPLTVGIILGSVTTVTAGTWISAYKHTEMKIKYNGQTQTFVDNVSGEIQTPLMYNDRTYLPVRAIAEMLGVNVDYDGNTQTVILKSDDYVEPSTPSTPGGTFNLSDDAFVNSFTYYNSIPSGYWYDHSNDDAFKELFNSIHTNNLKTFSDTDISELINKKSPLYTEMYNNLITDRDILKSTPTASMTTSNLKIEKYAFSNGLLKGAIISGDIKIYNNGSLLATENMKLLILPDTERGIPFTIYCQIID